MKKIYFFILTALVSSTLFAQNPAINFDGTDDYIQTTFGGVTGSADRTFEAWIYVDPGAPASNLCILDYGTNAAGDRNTFAVSGTRKLTFTSGGTNANIGSTNINVIPDGVWTHVAFVLDAGTGYLYVNGALVGSGNLSNVSTPTSGSDMRIGERVTGGSILFNGSIDEVRVYDVARTATEISTDMNSELCTLPSSLVAYYRMNDGTIAGTNMGTTIDESGNNNTGTLNNFALTGTTSNWTTGPVLGGGFTTSNLVINACSDYTGPSGTVYTASGLYSETATNAAGCDSIVQIDLTIAPLTSSINETVCDSYTSPSGTYTWTASGVYADTLVTTAGCDSVITINLTIDSYETTVFGTDCDAYTSMSGNNTWTASGVYTETFTTAFGCDSIIIYDITITGSTSSTINPSICGGDTYTSSTGMTYTAAGTYTETLVNANGCDSVVTINLTVNDVNTDVTINAATLTADQTGATYQWYSCVGGNLVVIPGATGISYTATTNGDYAVEVTFNGCVSTSTCHNIDFTGVDENTTIKYAIYPNPSVNGFTVEMSKTEQDLTLSVLDLQGKVIMKRNISNMSKVAVTDKLPSGVYFVQLKTNSKTSTSKLVVL